MKRNKTYLFGAMFFVAILLIICIEVTYAYYNDTSQSFPMISSLVGDFDSGDGDINIIIYKQTSKGGSDYTRTYGVPALGYTYNEAKTTCTPDICSKEGTDGKTCHYKYDEENKNISLTSNQKVTCKFYFDQAAESDINVYIMIEDKENTTTSTTSGYESYEGKNYKNVNNIPAFGYTYAGYKCEHDETQNAEPKMLTYDPETNTFKLETKEKNTCYAYFNSIGAADIITHVYVQNNDAVPDEELESSYTLVDSIPTGNKYKINTSNSKCKIISNESTGESVISNNISYNNGYITINDISTKQECDVYLDLDTSTGN